MRGAPRTKNFVWIECPPGRPISPQNRVPIRAMDNLRTRVYQTTSPIAREVVYDPRRPAPRRHRPPRPHAAPARRRRGLPRRLPRPEPLRPRGGDRAEPRPRPRPDAGGQPPLHRGGHPRILDRLEAHRREHRRHGGRRQPVRAASPPDRGRAGHPHRVLRLGRPLDPGGFGQVPRRLPGSRGKRPDSPESPLP